MRRPLKPFVTEYKPSSRRQSASGRSVQPVEGEGFAPKPNASHRLDAGDRDVNHRSEDSYEAALRAADALFSPARKAGTGDDRAADGDEGVEHPQSAPAKGGRILRVIDEPPSEVLSAMEEEGPKRRGRKPGSKNKPKIPATGDFASLAPSSVTARSVTETNMASASSAAVERQRASRHRKAPESKTAETGSASGTPSNAAAYDFEASSPQPSELAASGPGAPVGDDHGSKAADPAEGRGADEHGARLRQARPPQFAPRGYRRFSWIRTKLKPGQEWKRRLPKICW